MEVHFIDTKINWNEINCNIYLHDLHISAVWILSMFYIEKMQ